MDDGSAGRRSVDDRAVPRRRGRRGAGILSVALPAVTFLIGLLLGVAVWSGGGGDDLGAPPGNGADGSGERVPDPADRTLTATVPDECLAAVAEGRRLLDLVDEGRSAVGDFDLGDLQRLQRIFDELESSSQHARVLGEECQARADVSVASPS